MSGSPVLAYRISIEVVLVVVILGSVYSIYRRRRQRRLETTPMFEAEKIEGARPWSRQSLINRMSLESGPKVEGEDDRYSFDYGPPMRVGDNPLPTIPPLAFNNPRLIRQPEDALPLLPPQPSLADLPAQPATALLSKSLTRRASDATTLGAPVPTTHAVPHCRDSCGAETVRSSLTSSTLPPSYHSRYPDLGGPNIATAPLYQWPTTGESQPQGKGFEEAVARGPRRSLDGGVRLAGGHPGEGNAGVSGSDEGSVTAPAYHDW